MIICMYIYMSTYTDLCIYQYKRIKLINLVLLMEAAQLSWGLCVDVITHDIIVFVGDQIKT